MKAYLSLSFRLNCLSHVSQLKSLVCEWVSSCFLSLSAPMNVFMQISQVYLRKIGQGVPYSLPYCYKCVKKWSGRIMRHRLHICWMRILKEGGFLNISIRVWAYTSQKTWWEGSIYGLDGTSGPIEEPTKEQSESQVEMSVIEMLRIWQNFWVTHVISAYVLITS